MYQSATQKRKAAQTYEQIQMQQVIDQLGHCHQMLEHVIVTLNKMEHKFVKMEERTQAMIEMLAKIDRQTRK